LVIGLCFAASRDFLAFGPFRRKVSRSQLDRLVFIGNSGPRAEGRNPLRRLGGMDRRRASFVSIPGTWQPAIRVRIACVAVSVPASRLAGFLARLLRFAEQFVQPEISREKQAHHRHSHQQSISIRFNYPHMELSFPDFGARACFASCWLQHFEGQRSQTF